MTTTNASPPSDRPSFNLAMAEVLHDHATLRHLADIALREPDLCTDIALSMADAMISHERTEARLFELPFVTLTPEKVKSTAAMARRHCIEYTSGDFTLLGSKFAAAQFIDSLMAHLAAEEVWFEVENKHQRDRLHIAA
jgi:hypothetical protein